MGNVEESAHLPLDWNAMSSVVDKELPTRQTKPLGSRARGSSTIGASATRLGGSMSTNNVTSGSNKLSDRELQSLWRRFKEYTDQNARDQLILNYAPLVKYVAGRMSAALPSHVDEADLISYGLLGLINAVERFDPKRRIKFETYAVTRIKGAHHRRAALDGLGAAFGSCPCPRDRTYLG